MRIESTGALTGPAQMPVYRHSDRLLKPSSAATSHRADGGIVLPCRTVIEIDLRVRADAPAKIRADEPVVELRRLGTRGGKTVV